MMMLASALLFAAAGVVGSAVWARPADRSPDDACSSPSFANLQCLEGDGAAIDACKSMLTVKTLTTTVSTTTFSVTTVTTSFNADSQSTFVSIATGKAAVESTTVTTVGPLSTIVVVDTTTVMLPTSTVTTYVPVTTASGAASKARPRRSEGCDQDDALSSLKAMSCPDAETACACLGATRKTRTATVTSSFAVPSTTTVVLGKAAVSTIVQLQGPDITKTETLSATSITVTQTVTVTPVTTVSFAAPTYTKVYGPTTGCADLVVGNGTNLDASVTDASVARAKCQAYCDQLPGCTDIWVQRLFVNYGDVVPYYACYSNKDKLNVTRDVECGRSIGIFGSARAWDAIGRGTVPL